MQITLEHEDIINALTHYVTNMGIEVTGKQITVNLHVKRKGQGYSAIVSINSIAPTVISETPTTINTLIVEPVVGETADLFKD